MRITIEKRIRQTPSLRADFFELTRTVFGLDFEKWYQAGDWTDRYLPYAAAVDGTLVANVSANLIDISFRGEKRRYIQIGAVMTAPAYRQRGFSRMLLEELLSDWKDRCDGVYLYANDSVLDFYPKFGFLPGFDDKTRPGADAPGLVSFRVPASSLPGGLPCPAAPGQAPPPWRIRAECQAYRTPSPPRSRVPPAFSDPGSLPPHDHRHRSRYR